MQDNDQVLFLVHSFERLPSKNLKSNQQKKVCFMEWGGGGRWKLFISCNLCQHLLVCFYWLIYRQLVSSGTWPVFADFTVCLLLGCSGDKHDFPLWYSNQFGNTDGLTHANTHARTRYDTRADVPPTESRWAPWVNRGTPQQLPQINMLCE